MKMVKSHVITLAANQEVTVESLTGLKGITRKILGISAELVDAADLVAYIDQVQAVRAALNVDSLAHNIVEIDHVLAEGQTLRVGIYDRGSGAVTLCINVHYEET